MTQPLRVCACVRKTHKQHMHTNRVNRIHFPRLWDYNFKLSFFFFPLKGLLDRWDHFLKQRLCVSVFYGFLFIEKMNRCDDLHFF